MERKTITRHTYEIEPGQTRFAIRFEFKPRMSKLIVTVDGLPATNWKYERETSSIVFDSTPSGSILKIRRFTPVDEKFVVFVASNLLDEQTNNWAFDQVIYKLQEESLETDEISEGIWAIRYALEEAREAAALAQAILDEIKGFGWDDVAKKSVNNDFTGVNTVPDTGKGTSSGQVINTRSLQKELEDFDIPLKIDFSPTQWQLVTDTADGDHGKYRLNKITDAQDYTHVYKNESYGYQAFDDNLEVRFNSEGYIQLVSTNSFAGFIYSRSMRQLPTYNFSPIRDDDGNITGLSLTGIASNPANLTELHLPSSAEYEGKTYAVLEIGANAFAGNNNIIRIYVGNGTKIIRSGAFQRTSQLVYVYTPDTVEIIESEVFYADISLVEIRVSLALRSLGDNACAYCSQMIRFDIPAATEYIGPQALAFCPLLAVITVDPGNLHFKVIDGVLYTYDEKTLILYPPGMEGDVFTTPAATEELADNAFNNNNLYTLNLNNGLLRIGRRALLGSKHLSSVDIKASVQFIGNGVAAGSTVAQFTVDPANAYFKAVDGVLYSADGKRIVQYPPGKTNAVFTMPGGVEEILNYSMYGARFSSMTMSPSMRVIEAESIVNCPNLTALNITALVELIGEGPVELCYKLEAITVDPANQHYKAVNGVLYSADGKQLIAYPAGKTDEVFTMPEGVEAVGYGGIRANPYLKTVTPAVSLKRVGGLGISALNNVNSLDFKENTELLRVSSCTGMTQLTTITFRNPNTVMTGAFPNCPNLMYVYGYPGSTSEEFAKANTLIFRSL